MRVPRGDANFGIGILGMSGSAVPTLQSVGDHLKLLFENASDNATHAGKDRLKELLTHI